MEQIAISRFKVTCLEVVRRVRRTGKPVAITRYGRPVAEIVPARPSQRRKFVGAMPGWIEILGDIEGPTGDLSDWEAGR